MTVVEFFGCTFLAFGPPFAMFVFSIAQDPVRIIILIAAAFFWLLSLLSSSLWWFIVVPLRKELAFGLVFSVIFQEVFRFLIYRILRKAENGLRKITDDSATLIEKQTYTGLCQWTWFWNNQWSLFAGKCCGWRRRTGDDGLEIWQRGLFPGKFSDKFVFYFITHFLECHIFSCPRHKQQITCVYSISYSFVSIRYNAV